MGRFPAAILAALVASQTPCSVGPAHAQDAGPAQVVPMPPAAGRNHTWAYVSLAGGVALIGLSFVFAQRADEAYAAYLVSTDLGEIERLYDRTVRHDDLARASLLSGEGLVAAGLYLRFIRRPAPRRVSLALLPSRCALSLRF